MKKHTRDLNFTQSLNRLEEIVETLENPQLDLEQGLKLLEEGVFLHKLCKRKLTEASLKIANILKDDEKTPDENNDLEKQDYSL